MLIEFEKYQYVLSLNSLDESYLSKDKKDINIDDYAFKKGYFYNNKLLDNENTIYYKDDVIDGITIENTTIGLSNLLIKQNLYLGLDNIIHENDYQTFKKVKGLLTLYNIYIEGSHLLSPNDEITIPEGSFTLDTNFIFNISLNDNTTTIYNQSHYTILNKIVN